MSTDEPRRPDPDALLEESDKAGRGKLKVFLGMAPGVGKTYEMLRAGRRRKAEGCDVAIGLVETHGRRETESLLRGMEVLARKPFEHRGQTLLEFDLDAALTRRPELLLVDEFAHSNAPGSRHPKRWQDIEELLHAGVDVWTTINVQHLESLVDVVWKITGVRQRETIPDSVLSTADEIELIDITPAALRQRLSEGKIYLPETARLAADNFFKPENLTALRELALRRAAQTVDDQLVGAMRRAGVEGPWAAGERMLVLITGDVMAEALVRAGRRLAGMMDAPWTVVHVERPTRPPLPTAQAARVSAALKLAEQLGGASVVLTGEDLAACVGEYAARNNVTQIVIGKPKESRWRELFGRSLSGALLRDARGAALHVITEASAAPTSAAAPPRRFGLGRDWRGYVIGAAFVAVATVAALALDQVFDDVNLGMVFLASVLAAGVLYGLKPALAAATVAFLIYNFLFLSPRYSFAIGSPTDLLTLIVFWLVALATGGLAGRVRDQQRATARRAAGIAALLAASRRLSGAAKKDDAARALAEQLAAAVGGRVMILLPQGADVAVAAAAPEAGELTTVDVAAARWTWEKGEPAGAGTGTLPNATWIFRPLQGVRSRAGVVALEPDSTPRPDDERYVLALIDQGAVALERAEFAADAADADALRKADRLRSALLNSISHDLRTPLSTVLGSATTLIEYGGSLGGKVKRDLLDSIREEAERLNRYVGDLLDMTRLEGGALVTRQEWIDLREVLNAAAERVSRRLGKRRVARDYPANLTMVKADPGLLEQAVVNILENAIAYSPDGSTIELAAYEDRGNVVASIEDEGRGIPTTELQSVFEKFRRMEEATDRGKGAGLGLAISKGFIEAMSGRIAAASPIHDGRGTRILISLPKETPTPAYLL
jgi:two-component system sensor histidine kinase KdpD